MEDHDGLQVCRLIAGILALQRLKDDVGEVDARGAVAVGFALHELAPAEGAACADLIVDHDLLAEFFFKVGLLKTGEQVGFAAGTEGDEIVDGLVLGELHIGGGSRGYASGQHGETCKGGKQLFHEKLLGLMFVIRSSGTHGRW